MTLKAHWHFDGNLTDRSGFDTSTTNGTAPNASYLADGVIGQSLDCDTANTINFENSQALNDVFSGQEMTMMVRVKNLSSYTGSWNDYVYFFNDTTTTTIRLERGNNSNDQFDFWCNIGSADDSTSGKWQVYQDGVAGTAEDEWVDLVIRRVPSQLEAWVNGELVDTSTLSDGLDMTGMSGNVLKVGGGNAGTHVEDLRFYDHAVSEREIQDFSNLETVTAPLDSYNPVNKSAYNHKQDMEIVSTPTLTEADSYLWGKSTEMRIDGGSQDVFRVPGTDFKEPTAFSTFARVKLDSSVSHNHVITRGINDQLLYVATDGTVNFGVPGISMTTYSSVPYDQWISLGVTWDGSTTRLFVDGDEVATGSKSGATNFGGLLIGATGPWDMEGFIQDYHFTYRDIGADGIRQWHENRSVLGEQGSLLTRRMREEDNHQGATNARYFIYTATGNERMSPHEDNTRININGKFEKTIDVGQYPAISVSQGDIVSGDKPFSLSGESPPIPTSWRGKTFADRGDRGSDVYYVIYNPDWNKTATVDVYKLSADINVPTETATVGPRDWIELSYPVENTQWIIESNIDVVAARYSGNDKAPLYPSQTEIYGVPDSGNIIATEDNTNITFYQSDGNTSTVTLNRGGLNTRANALNNYSGFADRVVADKPISAHSQADGDGTEMAPYIGKAPGATEYIIPSASDWVKFVGFESGTTVDRYDSSGVLQETLTMNHPGGSEYPGECYFGAGYANAARFVASSPVLCWADAPGQYETVKMGTGTGVVDKTKLATQNGIISVGNVKESSTLINNQQMLQSKSSFETKREIKEI